MTDPNEEPMNNDRPRHLAPAGRACVPAERVRVRRVRREHLEGMTLVEIMIVVIIMALIATAVGVAVLPQLDRAKIRDTTAGAATVASAVEMYIADNSSGDCPRMEELLDGYINSSTRTTDGWDNEFVIECQGNDVIVTSAGPDQQMGTEDDISNAAQ
ncbi:MAG: prepilin-type N-terminal cleavage/methylation domain-containing protein [Sandaracinaceae bacterium]